MKIPKKIYFTTRNFVVNHKTLCAFAAGIAVATIQARKNLQVHADFIASHGLSEEFQNPTN